MAPSTYMTNMAEWPWRSRSPNFTFQGIMNAPAWSTRFCGERGERGGMVGEGKGPWHRNALLIVYFTFGGLIYNYSHYVPWSYHSPMRHAIYTLLYPLNGLPHVSSNNKGHLELKNSSAYLFLWSTYWNVWNFGARNILFQSSSTHLSNGILHARNFVFKSYKTL